MPTPISGNIFLCNYLCSCLAGITSAHRGQGIYIPDISTLSLSHPDPAAAGAHFTVLHNHRDKVINLHIKNELLEQTITLQLQQQLSGCVRGKGNRAQLLALFLPTHNQKSKALCRDWFEFYSKTCFFPIQGDPVIL